jgi:hypothetical protein
MLMYVNIPALYQLHLSSLFEILTAELTQVNKIGRDSISYVESLIESIMGGLEGLINILDAEGGFGSLEMQVENF